MKKKQSMNLSDIVLEIYKIAGNVGAKVKEHPQVEGYTECVRVRVLITWELGCKPLLRDFMLTPLAGEQMLEELRKCVFKDSMIGFRVEFPAHTGIVLMDNTKSRDYWFPVVTCW